VFVVRGYRLDFEGWTVRATGLLVATSAPDGAQVYIDGELKSATNNTLSLPPGKYRVEIKKEGLLTWSKELVVEKELVTKTEAYLFPRVPSLSALTFDGTVGPVMSPDGTKLAFIVPAGQEAGEKSGLWVLTLSDLPLGFSRDPRQVARADLAGAKIAWSPDLRQILLKTTKGAYFLLAAGEFNPQGTWVNVGSRLEEILAGWEEERRQVLEQQEKHLPEGMQYILSEKAGFISFSPDETKVLYTATASATLTDELISPVPAASTQKQERNIKPSNTYIYDIKEDRNFWVAERPIYAPETDELFGGQALRFGGQARIFWFPTSRHVVIVEEKSIVIGDYDGTNQQQVYAGPFENGKVFPHPSGSKLIVLTNLNQQEGQTPNLYAISLR